METKVRVINKEEFYPIYVKWSEHYNFSPRYLDEIDTVIACYKDDVLTYTCFFWHTNSTFCVIGFPFANPEANKGQKRGCLRRLLDGVAALALEAGFRVMWTTSDTPPVESALLESGFIAGDARVNQYVKVLSPPIVDLEPVNFS